jgi:tripartite-type tricarboxylate transporter receptor subunit TctC
MIRTVFSAAIAAAALLGVPAAAQEAFPSKPIRIVVPFPPGGLGDLTGRIVSQRLGDAVRQRILVDNRPGGDEIIGTEHVARSAADGYTLLLATATHVVNPAVKLKLPFDPVADFAPVTLATQFPYLIVVHPSVQARSARDLIAYARANPGKLTFGSSATFPLLASAWFAYEAGIKVTQIPYKGAGPVLTDLMGGHIDAAFAASAGPIPIVLSGRLKAVAVTSRSRISVLPNVPTAIESGLKDFEIHGWHGFLAPARTPPEAIARLNAELAKVFQAAEVKEEMGQRAIQTVGNAPADFAAFMQSERIKWAKAVAVSGLKPQ